MTLAAHSLAGERNEHFLGESFACNDLQHYSNDVRAAAIENYSHKLNHKCFSCVLIAPECI